MVADTPELKTSLTGRDAQQQEALLDRIIQHIDAGLLEFLLTQIDSFIKWDLIQFFFSNPNTLDTAESIARHIGRSPEDVQAALDELSGGGVLTTHRMSGVSVYSVSKDPEVRDLLRSFAESCDDQQFKLRAIYSILRRMR